MHTKIKIFRTATIALSLQTLLKGQLKYLNEKFAITAISGADEHLDVVREREGVLVHGLSMQRNIAPLKDLQSLMKLYFYFKKTKPQIVHSITPKAGLLTMLAGKFAGVPIRIHTFTGLIFPSKTGRLQQLLILMDRLLCWAATHIIPEGNGVKNDLIQYKITAKPLHILANGNVNGINLNDFSRNSVSETDINAIYEKYPKLDRNKFTYVFVGRLVRDKGINELVAAFSKLNADACQLLLVGPFEQDLDPLDEATLHQLQQQSNIIHVGFQQDVRPFFALSDALVFPSYREGFPNVVLQAGALALPSIVTDINGSNEIIVEHQNGIIVPSKDANALKEAMQRLMDDNELYKKLRSNARPMIESRYEQSVVWKATADFYSKAINEL